MRVLLLGMGSRGDVEPLVALGQRLQRIGYAVSLAAPADLGHVVAGSGVDFEPLSFDLEGPIREGLGRESLRGSARTQVREARLLRQLMAGTAELLAADVGRLVDRADAVVSGALTFDLVDALLDTDAWDHRPARPHLYVIFAPVWPSAHGESTGLSVRHRASSWVNLAWSTLAGRVAFDLFRPAGDLVRARKGLPRRRFRDYAAAAERTPTILAASPQVVPPATDWPPALRQTGYWVRDRADDDAGDVAGDRAGDDALDPALESFLGEGEPPVFAGFGSMPTPDPAGVARGVCAVLARLGVRGVVSEGLAGLTVAPTPQLIGIRSTRHDLLFPRCAVVVHHGGAGTTAAAVRAGVPQVVVPHAADQPYWGRRMADLGVAPPPIPRKDLTAARLEQALEVALSPGAREAAYALGERTRAEDGAGDAAALIDGYLSTQRGNGVRDGGPRP